MVDFLFGQWYKTAPLKSVNSLGGGYVTINRPKGTKDEHMVGNTDLVEIERELKSKLHELRATIERLEEAQYIGQEILKMEVSF